MADEDEIPAARRRAAVALRRLGHAVVAHDADPELLDRVAEAAELTAATVEQGKPRSRPIEFIKRRMWEDRPADGAEMSHFHDCVISGQANPMGVAINVRRDGDEAVADFTLGAAFEGVPARAHGGIVAAIFDDVMGYVLALHGTPAFTGRLTVHYRAPVPMGRAMTVRARLVERSGRKLSMTSQMRLADDAGQSVVCEAEGLFIAIPPERLGLPASFDTSGAAPT